MNHNQRKAELRAQRRLDAIALLGGCCVSCGIADPRVLDVDHINDDGYADLQGSKLIERIIAGTRSTDDLALLCCNCHALKTRYNQIGEPTEAALAWAAGIIEGEGSIVFSTRGHVVNIVVVMTDFDVVSRLQSVLGGYINAVNRRASAPTHHKDQFRWVISDKENVERVLTQIMPWLGQRRRAKAEAALLRLAENKGAHGLRTHCPKGHEYTPENTRMIGRTRGCRECHRTWQRAIHARQREIHASQ